MPHPPTDLALLALEVSSKAKMAKNKGGDAKSGGKGSKGKGGDEKDSGSGKKNGLKIKIRHILW